MVHYGTTWDETTLLEEVKQTNLEMEQRDGIKRHFRFDWQHVAGCNEDYRRYVEAERERLGGNHPLFRTQYALLPVQGGGRLLGPLQLAQVRGPHPRRRSALPGRFYVAGIDLAGEETSDRLNPHPTRDATAVAIAEVSAYYTSTPGAEGEPTGPGGPVIPPGVTADAKSSTGKPGGLGVPPSVSVRGGLGASPSVSVVELYTWTGRQHHELYPQIVDILKNIWNCRRIVVDATGIGEPVASFLTKTLGSRVHPFKFTRQSKSELGFNLLAAINSGRLKLFQGDGSPEYREAMYQLERARVNYRPNQTMSFYVDPSDGHDDLLMSLALAIEATRDYTPKRARGGTRNE